MSFTLKNEDVTTTDLPGAGDSSVSARGGMIVRFEYVQVDVNGKHESRLVVKQQPRGDRSTVSHRYISEEQAKKMFPLEYQRFTEARGTTAAGGIPLSEIPGITMSQIGRLMVHGIDNVEELLCTEAHALGDIGRDAVTAHNVAKTWASNRDLAKVDIERAESVAELTETRDSLMAQLKAAKEAQHKAEMKLEVYQSIGPNAEAPKASPSSDNKAFINEDDEYGEIDENSSLFDGDAPAGESEDDEDDPLGLGK